MSTAYGEIIASDSQFLDAECHRLYEAPEFGSFIRADCVQSDRCHYAVVCAVSTGPFDGNRVVQAHRMAPGELEHRKPHLSLVLRTVFRARIVGHGAEGAPAPGTPPLPARLHCYVYPAAAAEVRAVTGTPAFLRALAQAQDVPKEDLLVAAIESARAAWGPEAPVLGWGRYLARLLRSDYLLLEGVMARLADSAAPARPHPTWEREIDLAGGDSVGADPFA